MQNIILWVLRFFLYMAFVAQKSYNFSTMKVLQAVVLFLTVTAITAVPLQLYSASTSLDSTATVLTGSLNGGRTIYIKGVGFPTNPALIEVMIGNYPCKIPADGLTPTTLSCQTTPTNSVNQIFNLPIRVISEFEIYTVTGFVFSYIWGDTPIITDVIPSASVGDRLLSYFGRHRVINVGDGARNMGDFIGLYAGNELCGMFDIQQEEISYNSINRVKCLQARLQEAGKYNVSEHVTPGWASKQWSMQKPSLTKQYYEHTVLPAVSSVTPNSGALIGQDLVIKGSGFSLDKTKVSVSVDGVNCAVSASTLTQINCRVAPKQPTDSGQLNSNAAAPTNNYISGSGFKYTRYNISGLVNRNIGGFKTAVESGSAELTVIESGHIAELETGDFYESSGYGQVFKGYFYAPVTGNYIFRGVGDDTFSLYMSAEYGTAGSPLIQEIYEMSVGYSNQNHYFSNHTTAIGSPKSLVGGKYYYMEAYHVNWIGPGYFKISVEVPNTDATLIKKRYEINHIQTTFTNDPEIMTFTLSNAAGGTFDLSIYRVDPATLQVTYNKQVTINFNAGAGEFQNALNQFDSYAPYGTTCTGVQAFDAAGASVALGSATAVKFEWTVSVYKLRSNAHLAERFGVRLNNIVAAPSTTPSFNEVRTNNHCPVLNGTFTLSIGGTPVKIYDSVTARYSNSNIPADVYPWDLEAAIQQFAGFEKTQVQRQSDPYYGTKWFISYIEYTGDVPDLVVSGSGLTGGKTGTSPSIAFYETRPYSTNVIFNPVNENFLFMASSKPNIIVKVNSISSVCLNNCEYTFLPNTPLITSQSLSGSVVSLTLSNPLNYNYQLNMLIAKVDGKVCAINPAGTFASFSCQLPVNSDNSPVLKAGDYNVELLLMEVGYINIQAGVNPMNYPLVLTSVTQNSGGTNGGYPITLAGLGFPLSAADATITLCGVRVEILSISNIETKILAPPCGSTGLQTITYAYNGQTATGQFTYTTPAVASSFLSIYPKSASPVLKAIMTINGTGFGTNISAISVSLANATGIIYRMRVLEVSDSIIKCGIPGGLPGQFDVKLSIDGVGDIIPSDPLIDDFVYELIIESVSPATVSYNGGTVITITGRNFAPDILDELVHVGNEMNWLCAIQSLTTTEIKCRVPAYHPDWTSATQGIVINNRLILDSECPSGTCKITYSDRLASPTLSSVSATIVTSGMGALTLSGSNLNAVPSADVKVIFENTITHLKTTVVPTSATGSSIIVNVPNLEAGYYNVKARLDPVGQTNAFEVNFQTSLSTPANISLSVKGGRAVITGTGLPAQWPSKMFSIKLLTNTFYDNPVVLSSTTTQIELEIPEGTANQVSSITLANPLEQKFTITLTQTNAATPKLSLTTTSPQAGGSVAVQLNRTTFATTNPVSIQVYNILDPKITSPVPSWTTSGTFLNFNQVFKSGQYGFKAYYANYGWGDITGTISISAPATYTATATDSSYAGGKLVVNGAGISPQSVLRVGGFVGKATEVTATTATFEIPPLVTPVTLQTYPELGITQKIKPAAIISDTATGTKYSFDSIHATYYSSNNTSCYIGIDSGEKTLINIQRIRYFPYNKWVIAAQYIKGAIFEASVDGVTYTQIGVVDQTVHAGWNSFLVNTNTNYRYVRMRHDNTSSCKLAEFEVYGVLLNDLTVASISSFSTSAIFDDGFNQVTLTNAITYKTTTTPVIISTSPATLSVYGNELVSITGQNLNFATGKVLVDNIECLINAGASTATHLECTTQARPALPNQNSFRVSVGNNQAIIRQDLIYVMRWSDIRTWGTDLPPIEGDLVYVPKGMALYVDQSTPRLDGIVVEDGKLIFADESDMEIHTNLITVNRGEFRAGTEKKPYQRKLTFIMYGSYYGKQQPMFGNKGIGCMECKFSMHGTPRIKTWSLLSSTVSIGATTLTVDDTVDWQVGEEIVVASTSFDHNEAERRIITAISGSTITVNKPFEFRHLGTVQTYGTNRLEMKAEVGLLTRNIKMMGDPTSWEGEYGSHLMLAGSSENGLVAHVAYSEFTHCGQPRIVGRYCIHFHMNGDVANSFAKGNAVHDSFARVITIHGVHFLTVSENVGYRVKGHNFFVEDGIETMNVIEKNLVIGSLESWNMMQTDISVASFWITNPTNHLRFNRAAGGDFYGFWYEIKTHPDGPSATEDICPIGNPLGESHDNVAHSYRRFGLRIFKLYSRERPCDHIRDDLLPDPWSDNPSIESKFYNYLTYKNGEAGLLAEQTGNVIFENFTIADHKRAGMEFYRTNFTKQMVMARNMAIIGLSTINGGDITTMNNSAGVIGPRSSNWGMADIRFYNFPSFMNVFTTCSYCESDLLFTNVANEYVVSGVTYTNITGKYLIFNGMKRQIIYDLDATFSAPFNGGSRTSATITDSYPHLRQEAGCSLATTPALWDNTIVCDQTIKIRRVMFTNLRNKQIFMNAPMKVQLLSDVYQTVLENSTSFTQAFSINQRFGIQPMIERKFGHSLAFVAGRVYNIWWLTGLDFEHLDIDVSTFFEDTDPAIIFKFNYTQNRELFEVGHFINGQVLNLTTPLINQTLDDATCQMGDYTHDVDNRVMTLCATSRGKFRKYQYLDVIGVKCRYICPSDTDDFIKENFLRVWSNVTQWPGGIYPSDGANITIPGQWTILMDMQPAVIDNWIIRGDVIIPDTMLNIHIKARNIWIKSGSIKAGTSSVPHPGKITFEILGNKNDRSFVIDPIIAGNKMFVVTSRLELYGQVPATAWTKLSAMARPGDTTIRVLSTAGWQVGGQISIASSFRALNDHEKVTITAINGNTVTFTPALNRTHYGASGPTVTNAVGTLDTRAGVGYLTRNIKIISGDDAGWGYQLIAYGYVDNTTLRTGAVILHGVELYEGGQYDTENTALKLLNTISNKTVQIYKSTFHDCKSLCLEIENINNAKIRENVFYNGRLFHVRANKLKQYVFENNFMAAATKRPTLANVNDLIACYATYDAIHEITASIRHNLCQGSDGYGMVLPFVPCALADNPPYEDNTVGSAFIGWTFNKISETCLAGSGAKAYACDIAHMASSPGTYTLIFQNFMIADSNRGVTLRFANSDYEDSSAYFKNSYVSAISRPTCSQCYGPSAISCNGARGVRMLAVTVNGQSLPMTFGKDFDIICRMETFDCKAFIENVIFENYNHNYGELPQCSNNAAFEPHRLASDITGTHHLYNTVCNNCSLDALARFTPPLPEHMGWSGGCGRIPCTGRNNYMIQDHTGHFLGTPSFLLANNSQIGDKTEGCTFYPRMNGHHCKRLDYAVIEYESIAPDFNTRIMWPVYLKFDGGVWNTTTNGWREWDWQGNQPMNHRMGRFVSIVQVNQVYNMTFESEPPIDMRLQFQRRYAGGNNSEYIVVKLHYPRPNSIRVQNRDVVMKPISLLDNNGESPLNTAVCGSNKFFYQNYTIHFVLTADTSCQVRVSLTNSIQLTARFSMDINNFFAIDGETKFINRMCAVLGIVDTSRLKIVGIYNGSVIIHAYIDESRNTTTENATSNDNTLQKKQMGELYKKLGAAYDSGRLATELTQEGLGGILDLQSQAYYHTYESEQEELVKLQEKTKSLAIALGVACASIALIVVAGVLYIRKLRAKIDNNPSSMVSEAKIEETVADTLNGA